MEQDQAQRLRQIVHGAQENADRAARVIAIASGKGGTGKTTLAVNLALAFGRMGLRVLVIDADFGLANVDLMMGTFSRYDLSQVLSGEVTAAQAVQQGVEGIRFLSGGSGVSALLSMDSWALEAMLSQLLTLATDVDIILLDIGAGITDTVMRLTLAADEAIIVTTPEPTAVMDAYALIKSMALIKQPLPRLNLLVNRVENKREAIQTLDAIISLARKNMGLEIQALGSIASDPGVPAAIKRQTPVLIAHPYGPASRDIQNIARRLVGAASPKRQGFSAFLARLVKPSGAQT